MATGKAAATPTLPGTEPSPAVKPKKPLPDKRQNNSINIEKPPDTGKKDGPTNGTKPPKQADNGATAGKDQPFLDDPTKEESAMAFLKEVFGLEIKSLDECHQAFTEMDADGSGWLGPAEFAKMLENMGCHDVSEKDMVSLISKIDTDHDELISFNEFLEALSESSKMERGATALERKIRKLSSDMQAKMERKRMSTAQNAINDGMKQSMIIAYLEEEMTEAAACQQLPWWLLLLTTFTMSFVSHFKPHILHGINQSIKFDIANNANYAFSGNIPFESGRMGHKDLYNIARPADFWSWLELGLVPLLFREKPFISEIRDNQLAACFARQFTEDAESLQRTPCPEKGIGSLSREQQTEYMLRNRFVGGLRLRQERVRGQPCEGDFPYARIGRCHPSQYIGYRNPSPTKFFAVEKDLSYDPQFFPTLLPAENITARIHRLEDSLWIGEATQRVELSFPTYHPEKRVLTMTYLNFYFSFGGRVWKLIKHCSVPIDPHTPETIVWDVVWQGQLVKMVFQELKDLIFVLRHSTNLKSGLKVYANVWKFLDWTSCFTGFGLLFVFYRWSVKVNEVIDYLKAADPLIQGSWSDENDRSAFFERMDDISQRWHEYRLFMMVYVFIIGTRFFESFNAQPRLSLVTKTLKRATVDLLHFGIVFMVVFMIFAVAGVVLFYQDIPGFTDVMRASYTLWRLILGDTAIYGVDFDDAHEGMVETGELRSVAWNVGFAVLVYFLLLNMILAIVLDWYTEVRGSVGSDSETLWSQAFEIYRRWQDQRRGRFIPLRKVVITLDPTVDDENDSPDDPVLTISNLASMLPGMTEEQATDIVVSAAEYEASILRDGASLSDAGNKIEALLDTILDLHQQVQALVMLTTVITDAQMTELKSTKKLMSQLQDKTKDPPGNGTVLRPDAGAAGGDSPWNMPDIATENQQLLSTISARESSSSWKRDLNGSV